MKTKKWLAWILSMAMAVALLAGCGSSSDESSGGEGGSASSKDTLVLAISSDPGRLRMDTLSTLSGNSYIRLFYDVLFRMNNEGEYDPYLCESWEVDEDNMGVTLHLQEGVKFHNGNAMTAEDVLGSIEIAQTEYSTGAQLQFIDVANSEIVNDNTLHLVFSEQNGLWMSALNYVGIVEKESFDAATSSEEFWLNPMTTSAYVLEDWVSGDSFTLTAFEDYYAGAPKIENVVLRVISESSVALMELQAGGIDFYYDMSLEDYETACSSEGITGIDTIPCPTSVFIGFNCHNEALSKLEVRQAIAHAIDLDAIVEGSFDGAAIAAHSPLSFAALGYDSYWEDNYPYNYDPELARQMLADAGYSSGLTFTMIVDETPVRNLMAEQLYNMLGEVGITLDIQKYDYATSTDIVSNTENYDMYIRGGAVNSGDTILGFTTSVGFRRVNAENDPSYEEFVRLTDSIKNIMDTDERAEAYKEFQKAFIEDMLYWIPGVQMELYSACQSNLVGWEVYGSTLFWNNAYFE